MNLVTSIATWWRGRQLRRAQRVNAALKQECRGEVLRQIQPTAYSKKSVAQLQKLARRGFRKGCEAQAELAQRELNRRGLLGAVSRAAKSAERGVRSAESRKEPFHQGAPDDFWGR